MRDEKSLRTPCCYDHNSNKTVPYAYYENLLEQFFDVLSKECTMSSFIFSLTQLENVNEIDSKSKNPKIKKFENDIISTSILHIIIY